MGKSTDMVGRAYDSAYLLLRSMHRLMPREDPTQLLLWLLESLPVLEVEAWAERPERAKRVPVIVDSELRPIGVLIDSTQYRWGLAIGASTLVKGSKIRESCLGEQRLMDWEQWRRVTLAIDYPVP